jgi:flavorubredoxin
VKGEKIAAIDAVKDAFASEWIAKITELVPPEKVDFVVCNHAEPDHSGSLPAAMRSFPNATLVCNAKCKEALGLHYDTASWRFHVVDDGATLPLGGQTLQFFNTPMVHWPESMVTCIQESGTLFSMDAFGQHYATDERFDDAADLAEVMQEAKMYYANIVAPYGAPVRAALAKLGKLELGIVCPSHGVVWRSHFDKILGAYRDWASLKPAKKVLVLYRTMWHGTGEMAAAVAAGAREKAGVDVAVLDLATANDTRVATEALDCASIAIGTPTLNMGLMPRMASALAYLRGLKLLNGKASFAFGSYGWASKGAEEAAASLAQMNTCPVAPTLTCRFRPSPETLEACRSAGRLLAEAASKA